MSRWAWPLAFCSLLLAGAFISCEKIPTTASPPATTAPPASSTPAAPATPTSPLKLPTPRADQADLVPVPDASGSFCRFDAQGHLTVTITNRGTRDAGSSTTEVQYRATRTDSAGTQSASATVLTTTPALAAGHSLDLTNVSLTLIGQDASGNLVRLAGTLTITVNVNKEVVESDYSNNVAQAQCPSIPLPSQQLPFPWLLSISK